MKMKILILDDDQFVGKGLQRAFQNEGHEVSLYLRGSEALQALDTEKFDVIFSDIMMPEMSGMDFCMALGHAHPEMVARLFFMTGAVLDGKIMAWLQKQRRPVLTKPLYMETLRSALRSVGVTSSRECQTISEVGGR